MTMRKYNKQEKKVYHSVRENYIGFADSSQKENKALYFDKPSVTVFRITGISLLR